MKKWQIASIAGGSALLILIVATLIIVFRGKPSKPVNGSSGQASSTVSAAVDESQFVIQNGGFETGDLTGWSIVEVNAFSNDCVTAQTTFWDQKIPFNQEGNWHLLGIGDDGKIPESATGKLKSSDFTLGGDGIVSMKIGAAKDPDQCYVAVFTADDDKMIAKQSNTSFLDPGVADPAKYASGLAFTNNYAEYKLDLKEYLGKKLYLEIVDEATDPGFGFINVDDIRTYYVGGVAQAQNPGEKKAAETTDTTAQPDASAAVAASKYEIANPGFETGDLKGWTVESGDAFNDKGVIPDETWWAEKITYNQDGKFHYGMYNEEGKGKMRSSTFLLGGSGWITFKLGAGKDVSKCYISVIDASTKEEVARFGNMKFANINFPNVDKGMNLSNMVQYRADLSAYLGKKLYFEVVDNATADWGLMTLDSFLTYYKTKPQTGVAAQNLAAKAAATGENDLVNGGFETGNLSGWTVVNGKAFTDACVSSATTWWAENIPFNQDGLFHLDGWGANETDTGVLRSSTFVLGKSGWISFKLGGGKNTSLCYVSVKKEDGTEVARFGNTAFANVHFPHVDQGMNLANLVQYKADLTAYLGQRLYIEIVDNATSDWGVVFADSFNMANDAQPGGLTATNLLQGSSGGGNNDNGNPGGDGGGPQTPVDEHQVLNGGFESGDLTGWTVASGDAFTADCVTSDSTWWDEGIPFNKEGTYLLDGWKTGESKTGVLRSSPFKMGGSGWISFRLGGGKNVSQCYISVKKADGTEVARFGNTEFADVNFPHPEQGMHLANMVVYKADLSIYKNQMLYFEIVDNATSDWGVLFVDAFDTYLSAEPQDATLATNLLPPTNIDNGGFETGDLSGWTVANGDAWTDASVSDAQTWWNENIPFDQEGTYHLDGWVNGEDKTGSIRSNAFTLSGSGWMKFMLGGGKDTSKCYISVKLADDDTELVRFGNTAFADINFPHIDQGMHLANLVAYKADLSAYLGQKVYIEITDNATSDWGVLFADGIDAKLTAEPTDATLATSLITPAVIAPGEIVNGGFETGDLTGWTVESGNAFSAGCILSQIHICRCRRIERSRSRWTPYQ